MTTKRIKNRMLTITLGIMSFTGLIRGQNLLDSLKACYALDCPNGGIIANGAATGSALDGTINGNVTCTSGHLGASNTGMKFGGTNADYIALPNNALIKPSTALTIAGWFEVNTASPLQVLVYANNGCSSNFDAFSLVWDGASNVFRGYKRPGLPGCGGGAVVSSPVMTTGWHYVVWYLDNSVLRMTVDNGVTNSVGHTVPFNYSSTGVILGGTGLSINAPFNGKMDNLRFYTRQLTAPEITSLYTTDPGCGSPGQCIIPVGAISRWDFSNSLTDGISANNGTWMSKNGSGIWITTDTPTYVNDRCGQAKRALRFNGTSNYVRCINSGPLGQSARSLSFWMRTNNQTAGNASVVRGIFNYGEYDGNASYNPPNLSSKTGSRWEICHNYGCQGVGIDISYEYVQKRDSCINNGLWHHVVITQATSDSLKKAKIYIDGSLIANPWMNTCSTTGNGGINATLNQLITIGAVLNGNISSAPIRFFDGDLDDIYLYNRVLAQSAVDTLYGCRCSSGISISGLDTVCQGKTYTYTATSGLSNYSWTLPGAGWAIQPATNSNILVVKAGAGSGYIKLTSGLCVEDSIKISSIDCCKIPPAGFTVLTDNMVNPIYSNNSYLIKNNITLSNSTMLLNSEFMLAPNVQITVPAPWALDIEHSHLYSCKDSLWQGIVVQDGGQIVSLNQRKGTTLIEDAKVAIDLDNITSAHAVPPINLQEVIFNKNHVGIKISNSVPALTTLPLSINSCVFTSRSLPYTSPAPFTLASWPSADATPTGLRFANNGMSSLLAPCNLQSYAFSNILNPYPNQPGHIGIKIDNIGNQSGSLPSTGVDIGITYITSTNLYNLFDGLGEGINVTDASLTTMNNIFQNMKYYNTSNGWFGGTGINHEVTSQMNAALDLRPFGPSNQNTSMGNRFWNCTTAVNTKDVFDVNIEYGVFRSTRNTSFGAFTGIGARGVILESNRFNYNIQQCEFNNIDENIIINTDNGLYDINGSTSSGTYADSVTINQNYFGPEVTSSTPYSNVVTPEYTGYAITFNGTNGANWNMIGVCNIISNKIDRAFRGIRINQMEDYPIEIGGNNILIFDDNYLLSGFDQYGIYANDSKDHLKIIENIVKGQGYVSSWNKVLRLIISKNNQSFSGVSSPIIHCNDVEDGYVGFEFDGSQLNTSWLTNIMRQKMAIGLSMVNNGAFGIQGSLSLGSGNEWKNNGYTLSPNIWSSNWQTFVFAPSSALNSFIWGQSAPSFFPITNGNDPLVFPFSSPSSLDSTSFGTECVNPNSYPATPSQKTMSLNEDKVNKKIGNVYDWTVEVFPNPSNGDLNISSTLKDQLLKVRILDITGKVVYSTIIKSNEVNNLNVSSLKASLYFIEIQNENEQVVRKKLIIE